MQTLRCLALYATLPSLVLQTCITYVYTIISDWSMSRYGYYGWLCRGFTLTPSQVLLTALLYSASVILPGIISWASTRYLHPKERGVLAGMSLGSSMELFALPLVCLCCGQEALHAGMVCLLVNLVATHVLAPLYFSTAGPAFPKNFQHTDGGVYNGEWKGALKDGFGVYQVCDDVFRPFEPRVVIPHLKLALASKFYGVRYWASQWAMEINSLEIVPEINAMLNNPKDVEAHFYCVAALMDIWQKTKNPFVSKSILELGGKSKNSDVAELIDEHTAV